MFKEVWNDTEYEGLYRVSNLGRVKSLNRMMEDIMGRKRKFKGQILKSSKNSRGYFVVDLCKDGKRKTWGIHQLVAKAFLPNPQNLPEVNHKNGIKTDNRAENLEWCTSKQNGEHAAKNDLTAKGEKIPQSKLTGKEVLEIRQKYIPHKYSQCRLAKDYKVSQSTISYILNKDTWSHV